MKITCKYNTQNMLPKNLKHFAFGQIDNELLDLTIGKEYISYGLRVNDLGKFYFVVLDSEKLPWWMPVILFDKTDIKPIDTWRCDTELGPFGQDSVWAYPAYFGNEEEIEDGDEQGYLAFKQMQEQAKNSKN